MQMHLLKGSQTPCKGMIERVLHPMQRGMEKGLVLVVCAVDAVVMYDASTHVSHH